VKRGSDIDKDDGGHHGGQPRDLPAAGSAGKRTLSQGLVQRRISTADAAPDATSSPPATATPVPLAEPVPGGLGDGVEHLVAPVVQRKAAAIQRQEDKDAAKPDVGVAAGDADASETDPARPGRPAVKPSKPKGWPGSFSQLGDRIGWPERNVKRPGEPGRSEVSAENVDLAVIRSTGIDEAWAAEQANVYAAIAASEIGRNNPSARLRAEWLARLAERLRNEPGPTGEKTGPE